MACKIVRRREWTKEDVRILKTLTKEGAKRSVIARKLKRTEDATRQKAYSLGLRALAKKSRKA
jgi:hypothetical protein